MGGDLFRRSRARPLGLERISGPRPDEGSLALDNPLVDRLRRSTTMRLPRGSATSGDASDPASDAMIALGGEVAVALEAGGGLAGVVVLGPKQTGAAFEDDEIAFLSAHSVRSPPWPCTRPAFSGRWRRSITSCTTRSRKSPSNNDAF